MNTLAHDHLKTVEKQADINRKLTPPEVDADIALAQDTRKHVIVIKCKNRIPFRADRRINITKNELVSDLMLREEEFLPDASPRRVHLQRQTTRGPYSRTRAVRPLPVIAVETVRSPSFGRPPHAPSESAISTLPTQSLSRQKMDRQREHKS
jgi:hypothetical protein